MNLTAKYADVAYMSSKEYGRSLYTQKGEYI